MGTAPVTPRARARLIIGALLFLAVAVPGLLAFYAGLQVGRDIRVDELEQRIEQLELDVGNLMEDMPGLRPELACSGAGLGLLTPRSEPPAPAVQTN